MSGALHTPGPWIADFNTGPAPLVRREDGHPVCLLEDVRTGGPDRPAANARLIAAAPDLLALAHQVAGECAGCNGHGEIVVNAGPSHDAQFQTEPCPDCADIRAVIARAEGRS